jgi:hypothetical protein
VRLLARLDPLVTADRRYLKGVLAGVLEDLSVSLHEIADSLEHYRGRYGNWQEQPEQKGGE